MDKYRRTSFSFHTHRIGIDTHGRSGRIVYRRLSCHIRVEHVGIGEGQFVQFDGALRTYRIDSTRQIRYHQCHDTITSERRDKRVAEESSAVVGLVIPDEAFTLADSHFRILGIPTRYDIQIEGHDRITSMQCRMQFAMVDTRSVFWQEVVIGIGLTLADSITEDGFLRREDLNLKLVNAIPLTRQSLFMRSIDGRRISMDTRHCLFSGEEDIADLHILILASRSIGYILVEVSETDIIDVDSNTGVGGRFRLAVETDLDILTGIRRKAVAYLHTRSRYVAELFSFRIGVLPFIEDISTLPGSTSIIRDDNHEVIIILHIILRYLVSRSSMGSVTSGKREIHREMHGVILREIEVRRNEPVEVRGVSLRHIMRSFESVSIRCASEAPVVHATRYNTGSIEDIICMRLTECPFVRIEVRIELLEEVRAARGAEGTFLRERACSPSVSAYRFHPPNIGSERLEALNRSRIRVNDLIESELAFIGKIRVGSHLQEIASCRVNTIPAQYGMGRTYLEGNQFIRCLALRDTLKGNIVQPYVVSRFLRASALLMEGSHERDIRSGSSSKFNS